jgi:S1-C subfamily serine protease
MTKKILLLATIVCAAFQGLWAQSSAVNMLDRALSGVVTVAVYERGTTKKTLGFRGNASDIAYQKVLDISKAQGSGSGFVVQYGGKYYVITNAHVVEQATDKEGSLYVYSISQKEYKVKILGGDTFYDIAVLEFIDAPGSEMTALKFRKTEARIGEQVYAIGNPLGDYPYTVTEGIISAKNRVRGGLTGKFGFLQTTATVIWGNSGGPLVDGNGDVVGINSQIAFAEKNNTQIWQPQINFALEGTLSDKLVNDVLTNNGLVKRAFLGIEISRQKLNPNAQQQRTPYNRYQKEQEGELNNGWGNPYQKQREQPEVNPNPVISGVLAEGPANDKLSPYIGYTVKKINNVDIRNTEEALGALEKVKPGETVTFELERNGNKVNVSVTSRTLNASTSALIGKYVARQWGADLSQNNDNVFFSIKNKNAYSSYQKNATELINYLDQNGTAASSDMLFNQDWQIVGAGIVTQNAQVVFKTKDMADLGAALKLAGTTGVVDLLLFRRYGDPNDDRSYIRKRFVFSGEDSIFKETVWY